MNMLDNATVRPSRSLALTLLPIMAAVFVTFLVTGATLPALPLHIHDRLGFDAFVVGVVAAAQFAASLISRLWAGSFSDTRGPKFAVLAGLAMAAVSGVLYLVSLTVIGSPVLSVVVLLFGRAFMGGAESFVITGAQSWGLALAGREASGKVIGWIGTAMFISLAAGAPVGSLLFGNFGFVAIGAGTLLISVLTAILVLPMRTLLPPAPPTGALREVLRAVIMPGTALSLASLANGVITAFGVLYFTEQAWQPAWLSFTAFAGALVLSRLVLGHLPDRLGGVRTAWIFTLVQAAGMVLAALSPAAVPAFVGCFVAGFGYALVYPALGREAVRLAPQESRGLAMAVFTAFLDVALGILTPLLGLLAGAIGLRAVFLASAVLALCSLPLIFRLKPRIES
jgi:MFS family permease